MKKRLHDKKAGIAILAVLFILSLADVILRATVFSNVASTASNYGEVIIMAAFSVLLMILAVKGKDRAFHVLCGVWLGYFVLEQLFDVPYMLSSFVLIWETFASLVPMLALLLRFLGMICTIVVGALLVEYMIDGTIYNKAFNGFCIAAVLTFAGSAIIDIGACISSGEYIMMLSALNTLSNISMVFLFTFFAYDSAKAQLKKVDFTK
jgi:hypothetical protein